MKRQITISLLLCLVMMVRGQNECHYWFDEDVNTMKSGTYKIGINTFDADVSALTNGLHVINYVVMENGEATSMKSKAFVKTEVGGYTDCTLRYWFNNDSTVNTSPLTAGKNVQHSMDVSHLHSGTVHVVNMVVMKEDKLLSPPVAELFYIPNDARFDSATTQLVYWIDENADSICKGSLADNGAFFFDIDVSELENGEHTIYFALVDGEYMSEIEQAVFTKVEATNIETPFISAKDTQHVIYDLQGNKVISPSRNGIYIISGKKTMVK